jgi:heme-degrading monooxygenase HmoA
MYVVMNRFQIVAGREADFENSWKMRESFLQNFEGFRSFALLRNQAAGDGTVEYISHTIWANREAFEKWRQSQEFNRAHGGPSMMGVVAGPPQAAMYEAVLEEVKA